MRKMPSPKNEKRQTLAPSWRSYFLLALSLLLLAACNNTPPVPVPTPAEEAAVPTLTPSTTPLPGSNATATWTPRASMTPYVTPTFVNTAVPPSIATRESSTGVFNPIGGGSSSGGGSGSGTLPTVTRAIPRSTQTAVAVTATAAVSATQQAATATRGAATATALAASATPLPNNWRGSYFSNQSLSGLPTLVRNDTVLNFNWGGGSPDSTIPIDHFSARWEGNFDLASANYLFYAFSDDGIRVFLDDIVIIDEWHGATNRVFYATRAVTAGQHRLRVEYYEENGNAYAGVAWMLLNESAWIGEYYTNRDLTGPPQLVRQDAATSFDWGSGGPNGLNQTENFSIRWQRTRDFTNGRYEFVVTAEDGVRLFVDNTRLINEWHENSSAQTYRNSIVLSGEHRVTVEYFKATGNGRISVEIIPRPVALGTPPAKP